MDMYMVTEECPHCQVENTFDWHPSTDGFKAFCPHCGKRLMLCSECDSRCDYSSCSDTCKYNNPFVEICTYGEYDEASDNQDIIHFKVPRKWLCEHIKDEYKSVGEFLDNYTYDYSIHLYGIAILDGVLEEALVG